MKNLPSTRRLQLFDELARQLNFHRTAEVAGIAQPALTRTIKQLEDEIGFALFTRTTRTTQLTPAGKIFHVRLEQWLRDLDTSIRDCRRMTQEGGQRRMSLGYSAQASQGSMSQQLFRFGLRHNDVELSLRQLPSEVAYEEIASGDLHGAFVLHDSALLDRFKLRSVFLERQALVILCSSTHKLAGRKRIAAHELQRWPIALGSAARWQVFRKSVLSQLADLGVNLRIAYEADDTPLLLEAIAHGNFLGIYGSAIATQLPSSVVARDLKERLGLAISFVYGADAGHALQDLVAFLGDAGTLFPTPTTITT